jgi:hypothetical protein
VGGGSSVQDEIQDQDIMDLSMEDSDSEQSEDMEDVNPLPMRSQSDIVSMDSMPIDQELLELRR